MTRAAGGGGSGSGDLARRAEEAVAGFTSTGSKAPEAMFLGPGGPTHLVRSSGARVLTADGLDLLDWTMALGAVALGYAHPKVVEAVERAVRDGAVGPLPHRLEIEVAERLCAAYPGAAQARFLKTGAEAVQAAVRIARAATGRDRVVHAGYSGWLDGPTVGTGVPAATAALWTAVPFDDVAALEAAVAEGSPPAAILLEPVVERAPSAAWLRTARRLAGERTVLIFDEIKTGFRLGTGGAAQRWGVTPDLAVLGKALANGFPLAAVVGPADLMARVRSTWISSTLATEFVALAAANAVLDVWGETDVAAHLRLIGRAMLDGLAPLAASGLEVCGLPEMWFLRFGDSGRERRFLLGCVRRGVLLKRGGYNFPSLSHQRGDVDETLKAVRDVLAEALR
ncbi:MAG TPA: aminotransferase class III-fold pyridoxal phosphate-dependent enzyme [Gemmatimonadales bacterium]|nr:aminotransferase class III-fold pyridoxal phosphate-dependent enzyme [Gemmatimonadales bacterium]